MSAPPEPAPRPDRIRQGDRDKAYRPLPLEERRAAFHEGMAAWERGDFFAAHEALEPAWMGTDDLAERALHQGLIKVAAAYVHAVRHNPAGIAKNLAGARRHLDGARAAGPAWGIDVPHLVADIDARLADPALAGHATSHPEDLVMNRPAGIPAVDPLYASLRQHDPVRPTVILDVREPDEFRDVRVPGSLFIPMSQLGARLDEVPRDRPVLVLCAAGSRSQQVTGHLLQNGWEDVGNIAGGITAWERMGLEVRKGPVDRGRGPAPGLSGRRAGAGTAPGNRNGRRDTGGRPFAAREAA